MQQGDPISAPPGAGPGCGPWNPGIESRLPRSLLARVTLYRPENALTPLARAEELADFSGLELEEVVALRPERLALHELLVRVTAELSVPDGERSEELGINFRAIAAAILEHHIGPRMEAIRACHAEVRRRAATIAEAALAELDRPARAAASRATPRRWLGRARRPAAAERAEARERRLVEQWRASGGQETLEGSTHRALARVAGAIQARRGRLWGERALLVELVTALVCNEHASRAIGSLIDPLVEEAVRRRGLRRLPPQARPVVMNTKGASASGKSTMRPLQRRLAAELGVCWEDFALISPDIWRKFLLDYASLGPHYKYAGTLTGQEVALIDRKLDRHMAEKAARGETSHLLIDRFRFDSFAPASAEQGSNLLTRFGYRVYMFYMITAPHLTVERAWRRGLEVGRYKAVDDLLAHNVEAYRGMPELFFTWALRGDRPVHHEFLDNDVAAGERPLTVAYGRNAELNVLDVGGLLAIERYRRIDIEATSPETVYPGGAALAAERNTGFLRQCVRRLARLRFAERASGRIYACFEAGRLAWCDREALARAFADADTRAALLALEPALGRGGAPCGGPRFLAEEPGSQRPPILGRCWATD